MDKVQKPVSSQCNFTLNIKPTYPLHGMPYCCMITNQASNKKDLFLLFSIVVTVIHTDLYKATCLAHA
jgi:hypothetical protein